MRKRFLPNMISALTLTATVLALTGCEGVATLALESTQPVADGTEITTDEKERPDEGATQVDLQETKGTTVTQPGPYGSITLTIPDGWEYHECSAGDDALFGSSYGIQICPAGQKGCVEIGYSDAFGVCGTGLEEKHETVAGADANIGYYDGSKIWSYVVFRGDNEKIVAETWDVDAWWNLDATNRETEGKDSEIATEQDDSKNKEETNLLAYGDQVMQILDTLQYDASEQTGAIGVYNEDSGNDEIGAQTVIRKVSKTAATVEFMRHDPQLEGEYMTGEYFSIEKKNGNQWEELDAKDDVAFKDIGIVIPQEDGVSHEYDWTDLYGELKPGDYRINVKVWAGNKEYVLSPHFLIR